MKKWLIGLGFVFLGVVYIASIGGNIIAFINMMNTNGKEFIGHLVIFIIFLPYSIFYPRLFYEMVVDFNGIKDESEDRI